MDKICFVVQRYGEDILGGSEAYCRQIAERLTPYYEVEVLTSKANDYVTWKNHYLEDEEVINGVRVHRFDALFERRSDPEVSRKAALPNASVEEGVRWLEESGPYCPELVDHLRRHLDDYKIIILVTYLYYPSAVSAAIAQKKSIMIPTAHDELPIHMPIFKRVFASVGCMYYLTVEEKQFVESHFDMRGVIQSDGHGGTGVDLPQHIDPGAFCKKHGLVQGEYVVYVGRIDPAKGCRKLMRDFAEYKSRTKSSLKLVMVGKGDMKTLKHPDIVYTGFVTDEEKFSAIAGSLLLIMPSAFESLSMVVLEAMSLGKPILVNGRCEVLKGHCIRSNAGLYYLGYLEFEKMLDRMIHDQAMYDAMSRNAIQYVRNNYSWEAIIEGLRGYIELTAERASAGE